MKVFLSYRQTGNGNDENHAAQVYSFADKLRQHGFTVLLDQFYVEEHPGGPNQWPKWCEDQVIQADKVIMVASVGYFRCWSQSDSPGIGLGAACETTVIRNLLYQDRFDSEKFRIAYFDEQFKGDLPPVLLSMPRFDVNNSQQFSQLVRWISGGTPAAQRNEIIMWPDESLTFEPELANRDTEFAFVKQMLAGKTSERSLLCTGPGNHGKSTFLFECVRYARSVFPADRVIYIDLKPSVSRDDFIDSLRLELAAHTPNMHGFDSTLSPLLEISVQGMPVESSFRKRWKC